MDKVRIADIKVKRDDRQRKKMEADPSLQNSIRQFGLINPIVITDDLQLVAGERRFNACKAIGWVEIPVRWMRDLSTTELDLIELEENIKRKDLTWQETTTAIATYHKLKGRDEAKWNQRRTAELLGLDEGHISNCLLVASHMKDAKVAGANTLAEARNLIRRRNERASESEINALAEYARTVFQQKGETTPLTHQGAVTAVSALEVMGIPALVTPPVWAAASIEKSILQADFMSWVQSYSGPSFNFIHVDFPYGVNVFGGNGQFKPEDQEGAYEDEPDIFWSLTTQLAKSLDSLLSPSGHLMFWLSAKPQTLTRVISIFDSLGPPIAFYPYPLIWHKSDGSGIVGDSQRWLRHTYEMALLAIRGKRPLVKVVADSYAGPGDRKIHPSCKPEPMLRHFFSGLCDEHTRLLDPTCGSGSALRAAESLGTRPDAVLGLELSDEYVKRSREALHQFRLNATAHAVMKAHDVETSQAAQDLL